MFVFCNSYRIKLVVLRLLYELLLLRPMWCHLKVKYDFEYSLTLIPQHYYKIFFLST